MYLLERMGLIFPLREAHFYLCSLRVRQLVAHRVGKGEIALLDIDETSVRWVRDREFTEFFIQMHSVPHLAFLHLCEGGVIDFNANFAGLAPQLVRAGIQAVVAMQHPISNNAAIIFSRVFYRELSKGAPIDTAVQDGRWRITTSIP